MAQRIVPRPLIRQSLYFCKVLVISLEFGLSCGFGLFIFNSRFFLLDPQVAEHELVEASVCLHNHLTLSEEPQFFCRGSSKDFNQRSAFDGI
jgi:hypothetical protein